MKNGQILTLLVLVTIINGCGLLPYRPGDREPSSSLKKISPGAKHSCLELGAPLIQAPTLDTETIHKSLAKRYDINSRDLNKFYDTHLPSKATKRGEDPFSDILSKTPPQQRYLASAILFTLKKRKPHHLPREIARDYNKLTSLCNL